jgi:alanine dehydrogenase
MKLLNMDIGVPKEIKNNEYRVGLVPAGVRMLISAGHRVYVEKAAGLGSGITDEDFSRAGAEILGSGPEIYGRAELIVKVKEPLSVEIEYIQEDQILFTFLHLAPAPELTRALLDTKCLGVAYETIQLDDGSLPLLTPMSEVAGRVAKGHSSICLSAHRKPIIPISNVTPLSLPSWTGAVGLGAEVYILNRSQPRLSYLDDIFGNTITTLLSNEESIARMVKISDLVIGAVLIPGAKAPSLVTREMIASMIPGSVVVDVSIDQGGCFETSRPTTHQDPVYVVDDVIHYCVTNIPSVVARTSTFALTNVTLPYVLEIAGKGLERAARENPALSRGINVSRGEIVHPGLAEAGE